MSRRDRCECAPTVTDSKRCFWLVFDQEAFVAASLKTDEELRQMFRDRLVWDNPADISSLRAKGLVQRIYAPSVCSNNNVNLCCVCMRHVALMLILVHGVCHVSA